MPATPTPNGTLVMGDTIAMDPQLQRSLDETVAAPSQASFQNPLSASMSPTRTTVLPRVEAGGEGVVLIHGDRERYESKKKLGEGGVGEVVHAHDNDIDRPVAVKRLRAQMRAPGHVARFVDEIRVVGTLEHPNIVPIHDVGVDEQGQYFFVMKYVEGQTLESLIEKLQRNDPETVARFGIERRVEIFVGILDAIAYAHARGIIHRDLKPANVMIGPYGEVTVMDWGLAKHIGAPDTRSQDAPGAEGDAVGKTRVGTLLGTPAYMSPEQARGEALDERSDTYALCVIFYELLGLKHYLDGKTTIEAVLHGVQHDEPAFVCSLPTTAEGAIPAELGHFLAKGLAKNKNDRWQTAAEMLTFFRNRAAGIVPVQCAITAVRRGTHAWLGFVNRHPFLTMGLLLTVVLCTVGSLVLAGMTVARMV